jgi:hypothetical protein
MACSNIDAKLVYWSSVNGKSLPLVTTFYTILHLLFVKRLVYLTSVLKHSWKHFTISVMLKRVRNNCNKYLVMIFNVFVGLMIFPMKIIQFTRLSSHLIESYSNRLLISILTHHINDEKHVDLDTT